MTGTIEYAVYNPLKSVKYFDDFMAARDYYLQLGNQKIRGK